MKNYVVSRQKLIDLLLEQNSNLLSHQCFGVTQNTQSNVRSGINTNVTANHSSNRGVNTITNEKANKPTTSSKKNNKTTVHKDNDDSNLIKRQSTKTSVVKKEVFIIGDSMIKYVNGRGVSRNDSVKVRSYLGATTDDFIDYVRPTVRKKPNLIIIHSGTNDIQNNVNTLQKIRKVISSIKEYDTDDNIKIALSSIIHRSDHDFEDKINETNRKLENLCKGKGMIFINNSNIDSTCLNRSKLHLNKSGTSLLIKNFSKAVNSPWLINGNDNDEVLKLKNSSIASFSSMSHLRNLRSKNAGNIIFSYLNINSIRNKFENLCELVAGNVDILCIAETKLDPSFPNLQFLIPGFHKPVRMDVSHLKC